MDRRKFIFVASSSEAKPLALALEGSLKSRLNASKKPNEWRFRVVTWGREIFIPSDDTLNSLIQTATECDFAVVFLTEDDITEKKGAMLGSPRDNTIFELGFFIGALNRDPLRCFMVSSVGKNALPSDLNGRTLIEIAQPEGPLSNDQDYSEYVDAAANEICKRVLKIPHYNRPELSLITKEQLAARERSEGDGGHLAIESDVVAVVVNSVRPVEQLDSAFCANVMKNITAGARYEYFFGEPNANRVATANLLQRLALGNLDASGRNPYQIPEFMKQNWKEVAGNLDTMKKRLGIHFRKRPPLQFCVHNAETENAKSYLRCTREVHKDKFVEWAEGWPATEIAKELTTSCSSRNPDCCIYHSTIDFPLHISDLTCSSEILRLILDSKIAIDGGHNQDMDRLLVSLQLRKDEVIGKIMNDRSQILAEVKKRFPMDLPAADQAALDSVWLGADA
jgi:predicted nucleotide-binding protein